MKIENYTTEAAQHVQHNHFPCEQCGAEQIYKPGSDGLHCQYCGHVTPIPVSAQPIHEYDLPSALRKLSHLKKEAADIISVLKCPSCGAQFTLQPNEHAGDCHFCGAPAVVKKEDARYIHPESLLPFNIDQTRAQAIFDQWIGSLWFAPSALKNKATRDEKLTGIYLPYWTYDSDTYTQYRGMKGIVYYDRQMVTRIVNGRRVRQVRMVPRIRWIPVSGDVSIHFDDVLIGATQTLPRTIIDFLHPWDLENLVPYSETYLSGFRSELYQVSLRDGFEHAKHRMDNKITYAIRRDIGGDQQQISDKQTQHDQTTFKHVLLPVWSAAFRYNRKTYRFVINARTGQIRGERPYSIIKITLAVIFALSIVFGLIFTANHLDIQSPLINDYYNNYNSPGGYYDW